MTTKTDYHAITELKKVYTPAQRGIVCGAAELVSPPKTDGQHGLEFLIERDAAASRFFIFQNG